MFPTLANNYLPDAQAAMGFVVSQTSYIETTVAKTIYPEIQYPGLIPVDTSANEWAKSITYMSQDMTGRAGWFHAASKDAHVADVLRNKQEINVEMADIGYRWNIEEIGYAMQIPGMNLSADRAEAARRAYEEFVDDAVLRGKPEKNMLGLMNYTGITTVTAPNGAGASPLWANKTADEILADINAALSGVYVSTLQIETADTILLPVAQMALISVKRIPDTTMTVAQFLRTNNVYTDITGRPLTIRAVRGLETAGGSGTARMIAYRRDPGVVKVHIPMTHRFMPPWQEGPLSFLVVGIFRLAGLEIRRPGAVRYVDGI